MTQWRDARLARALAHAPDALDAPAATTRAAILRHAHQAVAPAPQPPSRPSPRALAWWQRWTGSGPGRPWNAAFASVLLAGVVTSLWWGHEVPGPVADHGDAPAKTSPATPPAADAQQAPAPAPALPSPSRAAAPPAQPATTTAPDTRQRRAEIEAEAQTQQARAKQRAEAPPRISAPAATLPEPPGTTTPSRQTERKASDMAKGNAGMPAPALSESPAPAPAPAPASAPAPAPPPAPATPPAPRAPPAPASPATTADAASASAFGGSAPARLRGAPTPDPTWTAWRLFPGGQASVAREAMPSDLVAVLDGLLRTGSPAAPVPAPQPVLLRAELLRGGTLLGILELGERSMHWTPADAGAAPFTLPLEPAWAARLREAMAR